MQVRRIVLMFCLSIFGLALFGEDHPRYRNIYKIMQKEHPGIFTDLSPGTHKLQYPYEADFIPVIISSTGIPHLGLDLNLAQLCGSAAIGNSIEQYLLAYLLGAKTNLYDFKVSHRNYSQTDYKKGILSLRQELNLSTKIETGKSIEVILENTQIEIKFELPMAIDALYGMDKKDLEEYTYRILKAPEPPPPVSNLDVPDLNLLALYKDALYVWERSNLDSLFVNVVFLNEKDSLFTYVYEPKYPVESMINSFLLPQMSEIDRIVDLEYVMYGKQIKRIRIPYHKLFSILANGMDTALAMSRVKDNVYSIVILFYDRSSGIRHMLNGNFNPVEMFNMEQKPIEMKLHAWITGSATDLQSQDGKQPRWHIQIR